ncbi:RNA polymerase sigma factor [Rugosimonospora africana]|uniref:DNA-directed RNA polymerase sigma-70 factor n=1 Tax=Rugosimonospora africana TaxID=556532 RepID=A0A8J3QSK2_9ACTN|nr:RNA polymerase sigma factor [Rugosimonospora africana]GIH14975.1 DNA-directed RNA polymerase sigma-70 factor [Rugosimonospora africana]
MTPHCATGSELDDAAVIAASIGEPERFAAIFDRHAPHIHRYLARRLGDDAADDALGETFLAAFRRRHRYDTSRRDARPWLYGIATNLVGQWHRSAFREHRLRMAMPAAPVDDGHADRVVAGVVAQATRRALAGALARLAPGDRDVLLLIAWEELSYEQVATALSIPVGTVRSRLHRARRQVRSALGDSDPTMAGEETVHDG